MRLVKAELVESREILPGQWIQAFHAPHLATGSRAGQFVHVRTGDYSGLVLRRPFSINTADVASGTITIHFRTIGRGTEWFTALRPGDPIDMLGPLGRPVGPGSPRPAASGWASLRLAGSAAADDPTRSVRPRRGARRSSRCRWSRTWAAPWARAWAAW